MVLALEFVACGLLGSCGIMYAGYFSDLIRFHSWQRHYNTYHYNIFNPFNMFGNVYGYALQFIYFMLFFVLVPMVVLQVMVEQPHAEHIAT
jgi:hypothetical protein